MLDQLVALGSQVSEDYADIYILLDAAANQPTPQVPREHFHLVTVMNENKVNKGS